MPPRRKKRRRFGERTRAKFLSGQFEFRMDSPQGSVDWISRLDDLEDKLKDFTPVFKKFGEYMVRTSIPKTHQAEGRPKKWAPLAPSTKLEKQRLGYGGKPMLVRTGKLLRGYRYKAHPLSMELWNVRSYHVFHQLGGKHLPKRTTIQMLRQDKAQFTRYKNQYIKGDL